MTRNVEGDGPPEASAKGVPARDGYGRGVSPFRQDSRRPALHRLIPVSEQLPGYRGGTLRRDLLAGLTVAALALPAAMAYAELAVLGWVDRLGRYADIRLHPRAILTPGVLVYRLDDRLFFANASYVKGRVGEALHGAPTPVCWFVFDAEALTHVDATGMDALKSLVRSLRDQEITFVFARLKGPMRQRLREAGVLDLVGEGHSYPTVRAAVAAAPAREEQP
jgi:MFS superfamily sulfate permease-like transporter